MCRQPGGTELDVLNEWLNVLQSVQIPFALLPVRLPEISQQISFSSASQSLLTIPVIVYHH